MNKRKFEFVIEFEDNEAPDESNEASIKALKDYIIEALIDLSFDNLKITERILIP